MKENGQGKFASVLQYIDSHLEESLSLEHLAAAFALSPYHFHRQFSLHCGMPLHRYIQLNRLKRASYRLAFRERGELLDLALETGYESCEAFARAFKKATGQTPGEFRKQPQWQNWHTLGQSLDEVRESYMKWQYSVEQVQIVDFPATSVVILEHHGRPDDATWHSAPQESCGQLDPNHFHLDRLQWPHRDPSESHQALPHEDHHIASYT